MAQAADRITKIANGGRPAAGAGRHALLAAPLVAALLGGLPAAPLAATGDLYQVTSEKANLRAGPSDSDNVRTQLGRGEQLLELRREGNWYGVRVLRTGEHPVARSDMRHLPDSSNGPDGRDTAGDIPMGGRNAGGGGMVGLFLRLEHRWRRSGMLRGGLLSAAGA